MEASEPSESEGPGPPPWVVAAVVGVSFLLVAWLALVGRGDVLLYGDEHLSIKNLTEPYGAVLGLYDHRGTGVAFLLFQKVVTDLFGAGPITYRLPAVLGALGAVLVAWFAGRRLVGPLPALLATALLATTSMFVHYARFARAYSLIVFLMLVYAGAIQYLVQRPANKRVQLLVVVSGCLLPWVHLTTALPIALVGLAGIGALLRRGERRRAGALLVTLTVAAACALLLFVPAWSEVRTFVDETAGMGWFNHGFAPIVTLVFGHHHLGLAAMLLVPLASVLLLVRRRTDALVPVTAALAPVLGLMLLVPAGMAYAHARYLISGLPFFAMLLAWVLVEGVRLLPIDRVKADRIALGSGLAAILALFSISPALRAPGANGPFGNTNASLTDLPAFDVPWPDTPAFYRELADSPTPLRIVEAPEQVSRSILLYRNYWLQHGHEVWIGHVNKKNRYKDLPGGPYVPLTKKALRNLEADYLIMHRAIDEELYRYWRWVHTVTWPTMEDPALYPLMLAHINFGTRYVQKEIAIPGLEVLGEPLHQDRFLIVWKLR